MRKGYINRYYVNELICINFKFFLLYNHDISTLQVTEIINTIFEVLSRF